MAKNIAFVGGERQVNFTDPLDYLNGDFGMQWEPEVTALPNGHFVVVYENAFEGDFEDLDLMWQEFDETGARLAGPHRLESAINDQLAVDVAARASGGFAAAWMERVGKIQLALVGAGQTAEPLLFPIADPGTIHAASPRLATLANGSYFVAYQQGEGPFEEEYDIRFAIVNAAGNGFVKADRILANTAADENDLDLAASGNNTLVAWSEEGDAATKIWGGSGHGCCSRYPFHFTWTPSPEPHLAWSNLRSRPGQSALAIPRGWPSYARQRPPATHQN